MQRHLVALHDVPPQGQEITVTDPHVWLAPIAEFGMDCRITTPLTAHVALQPVQGGCVVRGTLTGDAVVPCDRCAEDTPVHVAYSIDTFAPLPDTGVAAMHDPADAADVDDPQESHVIWDNGVPLLDLAALCWEAFMLALPLRPLCSPQCKGLCAQCGANLNQGPCHCVKDTGDPRLAALRNVKIKTDHSDK